MHRETMFSHAISFIKCCSVCVEFIEQNLKKNISQVFLLYNFIEKFTIYNWILPGLVKVTTENGSPVTAVGQHE